MLSFCHYASKKFSLLFLLFLASILCSTQFTSVSYATPKNTTQVLKLQPSKLVHALKQIPLWTVDQKKSSLKRAFTFKDFHEAWSFMSWVALLATQYNHHPEWSNVYNRVQITWTTHDVGGISNLDVQLAQKIDAYLASK